jgi:FHA domain
MDSHRETHTLPEQQRLMAAGSDLIIALRVMGRDTEYSLPAEKSCFSLGSSVGCDLPLPSEYVSNLHCVLNRRGRRLRIIDQHSHNGTFFSGRREDTFDIGPGDTFTVASIVLFALDHEMQSARPIVAEIVGSDYAAAIDELLVMVMKGQNLLFLGESGSDQARLTQAIHQASPRRHAAIVEVSEFPQDRHAQRGILDRARDGSVLLHLNEHTDAPDEAFRSMLLSSDFRLRLYVSASSVKAAVNCLGLEAVSRMAQIRLRPLRERSGELPTLLDRMLVERRATFRAAEISAANEHRLMTYGWPQNFHEFREAVDKLIVLATHESLGKAAAALDMPRTTLQYWVEERMRLELPLLGR